MGAYSVSCDAVKSCAAPVDRFGTGGVGLGGGGGRNGDGAVAADNGVVVLEQRGVAECTHATTTIQMFASSAVSEALQALVGARC
jgi:hypothetical protein